MLATGHSLGAAGGPDIWLAPEHFDHGRNLGGQRFAAELGDLNDRRVGGTTAWAGACQ
jgi:hypothetical protein